MINDEGMSSVRGLAALVVAVAHSLQIFVIRLFGVDHMVAKISGQMAAHAVLVFFIVSGYLITASVLKNVRRNEGTFDIVEYASSRVSRIYPPLLFSVFVCLAIYFLLRLLGLPGGDFEGAPPFGLPGDLYAARAAFKVDVSDMAGVLLMKNGLLHANGPLWSLYIEWRIYIAAACLAMTVTCARPAHKILWGAGLVYTLMQLKALDANALFYAGAWVLGGGVAVWHRRPPAFWRFRRGTLLAISIALMAVYAYIDPSVLIESRKLSTPSERLFQFLGGIFWMTLLFPRRPVARTIPRLALLRLGDFSYTLYIVHFPIMLFILALSQGIVGHSTAKALLLALASVVFVVLLSYCAGRFLERKERFLPAVRTALQPLFLAAGRTGLRS